MTKAEIIERYGIEEYERRKQYVSVKNLERYHNDSEYKAKHDKYFKERYNADPEFKKRHNKTTVKCRAKRYNSDSEYKRQMMDEHNNYVKAKYSNDKNYRFKHNIRCQSRRILFKERNHTRLKGYEIHHCFGYYDPSRFIYIPRDLHRAIHTLLRDNDIDADSNHYKYIVNLINESTEYTYVSA